VNPEPPNLLPPETPVPGPTCRPTARHATDQTAP
jgi:hypothetical protein